MKPDGKKGQSKTVTRRVFLKQSALIAGGAALGLSQLPRPFIVDAAEEMKTRVVVVTSPDVLAADKPLNLETLRKMLDKGICSLAGKPSPSEAWKTFVKPTDAVVFIESGTRLANVPEVVAEVIKGVTQASPKSMKLAHYGQQPPQWISTMKTLLTEREIPVDIMNGTLIRKISTEPFTSMVMIPTLKAHPIAGVSGVIKHFATICKEGPAPHHPNAMHTAGSVIVPQFGHLSKLIIVDALRFGEATRGQFYFHKSLVFGTDPVAVDTVALDLFLENCKAHGTLDPRFHIEAADKEFKAGTSDRNKIEVQKLSV